MMVNPGMDGYTKTLNHRKIPQTRKKTTNTENQTNTNTKIYAKWVSGFYI